MLLNRLYFTKRMLVIGVLVVVIATSAILLSNTRNGYRDSDFFSYWLAGYDIAHGQNPYEENQWIEDHYLFGANWVSDPKFVYPLSLAMLFVPLGILPLDIAAPVWIFLTISFVLASIYLLLSNFTFSTDITYVKPYLIGLLPGIFLFRPFVTLLFWGQLGGLFLFIITLTVYLFQNNRWFFGGVLLSIVLLKPQIGIPVLGLIIIWMIFERKWRGLFGIFTGTVVTVLSSLLIQYSWIAEWLGIGTAKVTGTIWGSTTIWGLSAIFCSFNRNCSIWFGIFLSAVSILGGMFFVAKHRKFRIEIIFAVCIGLGILITPYLLISDLILLLFPALVVLKLFGEKKYPWVFQAGIFLPLTIISYIVVPYSVKAGSDGLSAVLSLIILVALLLTIYSSDKNKYVSNISGIQ